MRIELNTIENIEIKFSQTEKMPWLSWDTPAWNCKTGSKLAKIEGTVCHGCYALNGRYIFGNVKNANTARFSQLEDLKVWQENFIVQLRAKYKSLRDKTRKGYFRWHTSGDIQSLEHLVAINEIAKALPEIKFWLPTKELGMIMEFQAIYGEFADNLCVRPSMFKVDQLPSNSLGLPTSTVVSTPVNADDRHENICPASLEAFNGASKVNCNECRKCWDKNVNNVAYIYH